MPMEYMAPHEVKASAMLGNRIARKIAGGKRIKHNAAIRHAVATHGTDHAIQLAADLLGMSVIDACKHVEDLKRSKPDDIVSPYYT